tara:strand:+ start:274 stop:576 length:303 start_codon:yes stop_codon:yes gene_type:complete
MKQIELRHVDFALIKLFNEFEQKGEVIQRIVFQEKDKDNSRSNDKYSFAGGQASILPCISNIRILETEQETKIGDDKVYITRFYTGKSGELEVYDKNITY